MNPKICIFCNKNTKNPVIVSVLHPFPVNPNHLIEAYAHRVCAKKQGYKEVNNYGA